jgi:hypothetical protein
MIDNYIQSGKTTREWDGFTLIKVGYCSILQCGILEVQDPQLALPLRDFLASRLKSTPRLQLLVTSDQMEPILSALISADDKDIDPDTFLRHLIGCNPILQKNKFVIDKQVPCPDGTLYFFRTCQRVVNFVAKNDYTMTLPRSTVKFNNDILRGLPTTSLTRMLAPQEAPTPQEEEGKAANTDKEDSGSSDDEEAEEPPLPPEVEPPIKFPPPPPPPVPAPGLTPSDTRKGTGKGVGKASQIDQPLEHHSTFLSDLVLRNAPLGGSKSPHQEGGERQSTCVRLTPRLRWGPGNNLVSPPISFSFSTLSNLPMVTKDSTSHLTTTNDDMILSDMFLSICSTQGPSSKVSPDDQGHPIAGYLSHEAWPHVGARSPQHMIGSTTYKYTKTFVITLTLHPLLSRKLQDSELHHCDDNLTPWQLSRMTGSNIFLSNKNSNSLDAASFQINKCPNQNQLPQSLPNLGYDQMDLGRSNFLQTNKQPQGGELKGPKMIGNGTDTTLGSLRNLELNQGVLMTPRILPRNTFGDSHSKMRGHPKMSLSRQRVIGLGLWGLKMANLKEKV